MQKTYGNTCSSDVSGTMATSTTMKALQMHNDFSIPLYVEEHLPARGCFTGVHLLRHPALPERWRPGPLHPRGGQELSDA